MKAIVVDVSRKSSYKKVISFLSHHNDAEIIYTFDYLYNRYASIEDLLSDLDELSDTFFVNSCAYYDMVISILGILRKTSVDSIIIYSPQIDESSRLSSEWLYDNYILHFTTYSDMKLEINFAKMLNIIKPRTIPLKAILERFSLKNTISMTSANDDYYDNDDDDDFLDIFKLSSFI